MELYRRNLLKNEGDDCHRPCKPCKSCDDPFDGPLSHIRKSILITGCVISGVLLICAALIMLKRYFSRRNATRERNLPILFDTQQDFVDEDHGPIIDHPIWYINTVGLPQSVIESITACQYKKDEGLIEGTECSVCLSEFEEGESVRLLPKCSHAFHLSCIDTWLRSHKNCPLCRAPIVQDIAIGTTPQASAAVPSLNDVSSSREDTQMENSENDGLMSRPQMDGEESSDVSVGVDIGGIPVEFARNGEDRIKSLFNSVVRCCDSRALSDLADKREVAGEDIQPMSRSVSMDASSAVAIYRAVANVVPDQGSSNSQLALHVKSSNLATLSKQVTQNLSLYKLTRSASLRKGPISMKRSYSSSRKSFPSKHGRSLSSSLPS